MNRAKQKALHTAIRDGSIQDMRAAIEQGAKVNEPDPDDLDGWRSIHHAATLSNGVDLIHALVELGAHPDVQATLRDGALHLACRLGRDANVIALLDVGANIEHRGMDDRTPLHVAATMGNERLIAELANRGADLEALDNAHRTPLSLAVNSHSHLAVVDLIERGARLETADKCGTTPLGWAVKKGMDPVACILIAHGADAESISPHVVDLHGLPAPHAAARSGQTRRLLHLLDQGADPEARHMAMTIAEEAKRFNQNQTLAALNAWTASQAIGDLLGRRLNEIGQP